MLAILIILLRLAGAGLIFLALLHKQIAEKLHWREEVPRLSPVNAAIFYVHSFFICLVLVMMGLPCLLDPHVFLEPSRAGAWLAWSFAGFWAVRFYCQLFVYEPALWRGKPLETRVHVWFSIIWAGLTLLFATCGCWQCGWLQQLLPASLNP